MRKSRVEEASVRADCGPGPFRLCGASGIVPAVRRAIGISLAVGLLMFFGKSAA